MKSLMIRGFPRSLTSLTYRVVHWSLLNQLELPDPSKRRRANLPIDGEVLARSTLMPIIENGAVDREGAYLAGKGVLDLHLGGFLIKDVLQPWVINRYLEQHPDSYNTLFIHRPLADILFRMDSHKWAQPMRAACEFKGCVAACGACTRHKDPFLLLAKGIVEWERRFFRPLSRHGVVVEFDEIIEDEKVLYDAVQALGYAPERDGYINNGFRNRRNIVLAYRLDDAWKRCRDLIEELKSGT